jgi:hypothetical protein
MKKLVLFVLGSFMASSVFASGPGLSPMVKKQVVVQSYNRLFIEGDFDVHLHYGTSSDVHIESSAEAMNNILIDQDGDALVIRTASGIPSDAGKMVLHISLGDLVQLQLKDVHSVESVTPIWFDKLSAFIQSHSKTQLKLVGNELYLNVSGSGDVHLDGTIKEAQIRNEGIGSVVTQQLCVNRLILLPNATSNMDIQWTNGGSLRMQPMPTLLEVKRS